MSDFIEIISDEEYLADLKRKYSSLVDSGDVTPKATSPRNPMSISSILPSTSIIPDTSPLSTLNAPTSPPTPRRPVDDTTNITSSQVVSDDVEMDPSGNTSNAEIDEVEPVEEGDMDEDDEGEVEGEGEGDEEDDSEDEEDSEDDEDEDDEEAEVGFSSFLGIGADKQDDIELIGGTEGPSGQSTLAVKEEPTDPSAVVTDLVAPEGEVNTLIPKKKSRKKREASADEDLPVPPPPMKTIRLTLTLTTGERGMGSEFNIVEEARKLGLEPTWQPLEEPLEGLEEEVKELPAGGILSQLNDEGMTAEQIAKRYEEMYDKPSKKPAKKKKVS
jgi:hypothetical protein